jgi:hypothetical protein
MNTAQESKIYEIALVGDINNVSAYLNNFYEFFKGVLTNGLLVLQTKNVIPKSRLAIKISMDDCDKPRGLYDGAVIFSNWPGTSNLVNDINATMEMARDVTVCWVGDTGPDSILSLHCDSIDIDNKDTILKPLKSILKLVGALPENPLLELIKDPLPEPVEDSLPELLEKTKEPEPVEDPLPEPVEDPLPEPMRESPEQKVWIQTHTLDENIEPAVEPEAESIKELKLKYGQWFVDAELVPKPEPKLKKAYVPQVYNHLFFTHDKSLVVLNCSDHNLIHYMVENYDDFKPLFKAWRELAEPYDHISTRELVYKMCSERHMEFYNSFWEELIASGKWKYYRF